MKLNLAFFTFFVVGICTTGAANAQMQSNTFAGRVDQVWEDGFRLNNGSRSIVVDAYDLCGDYTTRHIISGEQVAVVGEFEGGEFDAFSITRSSGESVCR
jgi:hypothetical protein